MRLMIGENIKRLRREKDITQEQLAEVLGVSYQSVSRWENDACYPDMELLPTMARFFDTTVDKLLGVNERLEREKVAEYLNQFQNCISCGDVDGCIRTARAGVSEFPNNYELLNKLMYALFIAGDEDGNVPDWKQNMEKYDAEITALGERIMKYCPDQNIRLEATARLAFNHCEMGRRKQGRAIYEALPPMEYCKENAMWWALEEEEKLPFTRKKIETAADALLAGFYTLAWARLLPDEDLLRVYEKRFALLELLYDGNRPDSDWGMANSHCGLASVCARLGRTEQAIDELKLAARCAQAFDERPEVQCFDSLLLGRVEWKRTDFETGDSRPLREIMREKWLASGDFDSIRQTREFQDVIKMLQ